MNAATRKILIVEDDAVIANIYRNKFEKAGYEVEVSTDGQAGFYRAHEAKPNVMLLDLMLPNMNGLDILKKIRAQKRFEKMPIFVFTNAYLSDFAHEAAQAGATQVFNKANVAPQQIVEAVNALMFLAPSGPGPLPAPPPAEPTYHTPTLMPMPGAPVAPAGTALVPLTPAWSAPVITLAPAPLPVLLPAPAPAPLPSFNNDGDAAFQAELLRSFVDSATDSLGAIRKLLLAIFKAEDVATRQQLLIDLYRKIHSLTGNAAVTGVSHISQMSAALAAFVKELHEKPACLNASSQRTLALSADFLGFLFQHASLPVDVNPAGVRVLVVDDDLISRRAITYALEKAGLKPQAVEDPAEAYTLMTRNPYDLLVLDVEMPGMDGFELCQKLRALPAHKTTPLIFVTGLTDFESRTKSTLSGGNDFIGKPFLFLELAVKALTYVLRGRINSALAIRPAA